MKEIISTSAAPAAIGPYSQGTIYGDLVYTSGQLPLVPETMQFVEGGIKEQAKQSLDNLKAVLEASGAGLDSVLKTTCFLSDMETSLHLMRCTPRCLVLRMHQRARASKRHDCQKTL